jgi:hypothetical protein
VTSKTSKFANLAKIATAFTKSSEIKKVEGDGESKEAHAQKVKALMM